MLTKEENTEPSEKSSSFDRAALPSFHSLLQELDDKSSSMDQSNQSRSTLQSQLQQATGRNIHYQQSAPYQQNGNQSSPVAYNMAYKTQSQIQMPQSIQINQAHPSYPKVAQLPHQSQTTSSIVSPIQRPMNGNYLPAPPNGDYNYQKSGQMVNITQSQLNQMHAKALSIQQAQAARFKNAEITYNLQKRISPQPKLDSRTMPPPPSAMISRPKEDEAQTNTPPVVWVKLFDPTKQSENPIIPKPPGDGPSGNESDESNPAKTEPRSRSGSHSSSSGSSPSLNNSSPTVNEAMFTLECKMNEYNLKSAAHILTPTFEHAGGNSGVFTNTGPFPFGGPGPRRKRRKFDEVDRKYRCIYGNCQKSYGTLNHLNHHIILQGHGPKRLSEEFEPNHSGKSQANRMNGGTAINQMNINPVNQMSFQTGVQ